MYLWPEKGEQNTGNTIRATLDRARELGINYIVVASGSGQSALQLVQQGFSIVCVTRHAGYNEPGNTGMEAAVRRQLEEQGVKLLTATHLLAGVDRALRFKFQGVYPGEIVSSTLRMFGQGVKVCIEISVMALDAGLIPFGQDIVSMGGTGKGLDAACVIRPAHSQYFFDTVVKEIICMPREK